MAGRRIDVEQLIGDQRFGALTLRVLVLAVLVLIIDGYDVQVMAFAAPSLMKAWHVKRAAFAPAFSASLLGILFGAPLFGWLGDRLGRKASIIISSLAYGLLSLSCLLARDLNTLIVLRFLIGIGMGGVFPNAIAIAAELSPRGMRTGMAAVVTNGITAGGVIPGLVVAALPAANDSNAWKYLFAIGGIAPLALAALVALALPESMAFLIQRGAKRSRVEALARQIAPNLEPTAEDEFVIPSRPKSEPVGFAALFAGEMALITPLLWVMFAATLLCIFMLSNWMPLLLEASGFTPQRAAATNSLFQVGGAVGGVLTALTIGRLRMRLVVALFGLCLVAVAVAATANLSGAGLALAIAACGFCIIGAQCALNGTAGAAYPTAVRARGVGMALGVGRVGSIIGPLVAGAMVAAGVTSARDLFLLPLVPLALGALAALIVAVRVGGRAPGPATEAPLH